MTYTDMHSHIAWGIDDGMPSLEDAKAALLMARKDGIKRILSTPHVTPGQTTKQEYETVIRPRQMEARQLAKHAGIDIFYGSEIMINSAFPKFMKEGWAPAIENTRFMLVEFNVRYSWDHNQNLADYLYDVSAQGYVPVVAHIERYFDHGLDWDLIDEWNEAGFVLQINATSLLGKDSAYAYKNAWELLKRGYGHIVSTDTHRAQGSRIESLTPAYEQVCKEIGEENAVLLFDINGKRILQDLEPEEIELPKKKRGFLSIFKK